MQIETITIHNFRSIVDDHFRLGDYGLLVGANNCGKSNVIDALRVFYEKDRYRYDEDRDRPLIPTDDDESWIEVQYVLTDEEHDSLKEEYRQPDNRLRVRKYLRSSEGGRRAGIYAYEGEQLVENYFYGAKGVQQGKLGNIIHIPAVSKLEDQTKLTGPSPLRDLLSDVFTNLLTSSDAFAALTEQFGAFAEEVKVEETDDKRSLLRLEEEVNREIGEWEMEFVLNINPIAESEIVKRLIDYKIVDQQLQQEIDGDQQGHGFQRHLIFALIRLAAQYQAPSTPRKKKDFTPDMTLILFEEPEAFLHPPQQDALCRNLKSIASHEGNQVLVSSHSSRFVSHNTLDIPSIIRLSRPEARTTVGQVTRAMLEEIFTENQLINEIVTKVHPDDLREEMEAIKYFLWLNPERCGMFFAGQVLLVEGTTERVLLNYLFDEGVFPSPPGGVFVLDCLGKWNIHRFMNLLGALRTWHSILIDGDLEKGVHGQVRELIERSKNSYTYEIGAFDTNIEGFLAVDKPGNPHRKPQHMMLRMTEGAIADERLEDLTKLVTGLLRV